MAASNSPDRNASNGDGEGIGREMEEELKRVVLEYGTGLIKPGDSTEDLLEKLETMEHLFQHIKQGFKELVKLALEPAKIGLISDYLLRHTDVDVRFTVASCITEIARITAPDVPYGEEQMKDYFLLVNTAFKELPSISARASSKAVSILQTISQCQLCVMMLDYGFHDMVHEMFRLFLNGIRASHPESVSSSMEHVMTVMIQNNVDSDESPVELAKILLFALKKEHENVSPLSFHLAKKVFENCANELKEFLPEAVRCMEVSVEEYDNVVVSAFKASTQRGDVDANEVGVYASSRGEVDLAGSGGLSKLVENDTDNLKDHENVEENHRALSRITDLINNQEVVFDIPASDGDCADVNDPSINDGTKTPVNKGSSDETRGDIWRDEHVKPWNSCDHVKNQKSVDSLSSKNLTDTSCSREMDSSKGHNSRLMPLKEDSHIKDHGIVFEGESSEKHISYDSCKNSRSEDVGNPNRVERESGKDGVPASQKRKRKPNSLIKPEEGYDRSWIMTDWVPTNNSCRRKNRLKNALCEDRIMISKASQSLHNHVGEQLNASASEKHVFLELNTQKKFLKERKYVRVDQDNRLYFLSSSDEGGIITSKDITVIESKEEKMDKSASIDFLCGVKEKFVKEKKYVRVAKDDRLYFLSTSDVGEIVTSKDIAVTENTDEEMDKSPRKNFLNGVADEVLRNSVRRKRSSTKVVPAKEILRKKIVLETGSSNASEDVHTLEEKLRQSSDKTLRANKIHRIPTCYGQKSSNQEAHATKRRGKTVVSENLSGDLLIKTLISQSRKKSSKRTPHPDELSNPQPQRTVILPAEKIENRQRFPTKNSPGETSMGKTVISEYQTKDATGKMAPQSRTRLSKQEAYSLEASNLQQPRNGISSKKNHYKKRRHAPARKTQKVTSHGKAIISDNQNDDIFIETLVSQSKDEAHSYEMSDPQQTNNVLSNDEASKVNPANKCYGKELVGCKIKVWWPMDKTYYDGKVVSYDKLKKTHQVDYDDGETEILDLGRECWK